MSELMIAANTTATPKQETTPAPVKEVKSVQKAPAAEKATAQVAVQNKAAEQKQEVKVTATTEQKVEGKAQEQRGGSPWLSMLPFILIFVVMIFFMNRSQKKQMQKRQEMMDKIAKGTKVLLTSGIYGTVEAVHDDYMMVEIASGVRVKVAKNGVAGIDTPEDGEKKAEEKKKAEGK